MTFWWLGRRGFGASGSSESLRGSLTGSVMASSQDKNIARAAPDSSHKLLFLLAYFANLTLLSQVAEPVPSCSVEWITQLSNLGASP